jgi:hypothetical protein
MAFRPLELPANVSFRTILLASVSASCAVTAATYSGSDMAAMGILTRRGLQATVNAVQTQPWRCLPSATGQQCGVSTSCASMQAQPQLDVQDAPVCTAEAQGSYGAFELGAIRNDWRYRPSCVTLPFVRWSGFDPTVCLNNYVCFSREEVAAVYNTPLLDLVYKAASVHRMYNDPQMVSN